MEMLWMEKEFYKIMRGRLPGDEELSLCPSLHNQNETIGWELSKDHKYTSDAT